MKNTILFAFLMLSFCACKEELPNYNFHEPTLRTIEGKVFNYQTNKPVGNIKFYLIFNQDNIVDSTTSDSNGNFKATFLSFDYWDHQLELADNPNYKCLNSYGKKISIIDNQNIYIQPYSFLKIKVKNVKPFDEKDKIEINGDYLSLSKILLGNKVDTTFTLKTVYNGNTDIEYSTFKNSLEVKNKIPIKLTSFDTTTVTINY